MNQRSHVTNMRAKIKSISSRIELVRGRQVGGWRPKRKSRQYIYLWNVEEGKRTRTNSPNKGRRVRPATPRNRSKDKNRLQIKPSTPNTESIFGWRWPGRDWTNSSPCFGAHNQNPDTKIFAGTPILSPHPRHPRGPVSNHRPLSEALHSIHRWKAR